MLRIKGCRIAGVGGSICTDLERIELIDCIFEGHPIVGGGVRMINCFQAPTKGKIYIGLRCPRVEGYAEDNS